MLTRFVIHVIALLFVFYFIWNIRSGFLLAAVIMAVILALVNAILRPILVLFTLPVTILTLGLFIIVINILLFALSFAILGSLGYKFVVSGGQIVLGWLIYVIVSGVLSSVARSRRRQ
ncbi:MAG TPA: phage holin family protein [Candidatus Limnocylindrales bacterium]|nr:phage holin family protein [Candidatus Limnocylindrales bacterium]